MGLGWFSKDTGDAVKSAGEGAGILVDSVTGLVGGFRNLFTGDMPPATVEAIAALENKAKEIQLKAKELDVKLAQIGQEVQKGQQEIEKKAIEKGGFNAFFLSGWRPALGWICALAVFAYYIPPVILQTYFWFIQSIKADALLAWPNNFDIAEIIGLVMSLLGMAGLRTIEKKNGSQGNH